MQTTLCKSSIRGLIFAAVVAGSCSLTVYAALPATAGQNSTTHSTQKKSSHKASASHTTSGGAGSSKAATTAKPTSNSGKTTATTSSARSAKSAKRSASRKSKRVKGQEAPTSERISEIQAALTRNHAYEGQPTGAWDDATVEAMKKFQAAHGLTPSGRLDAPTLQKLGLGSETAGLGAPNPPPNAAANRLLSSSNAIQSTRPE